MLLVCILVYFQTFLFTSDELPIQSEILQVLTELYVHIRISTSNWWTITREWPGHGRNALERTQTLRRRNPMWLQMGKMLLMQMVLNFAAIALAIMMLHAYAPLNSGHHDFKFCITHAAFALFEQN